MSGPRRIGSELKNGSDGLAVGNCRDAVVMRGDAKGIAMLQGAPKWRGGGRQPPCTAAFRAVGTAIVGWLLDVLTDRAATLRFAQLHYEKREKITTNQPHSAKNTPQNTKHTPTTRMEIRTWRSAIADLR